MKVEEKYQEIIDRLKAGETISDKDILKFIHAKALKTTSGHIVFTLTYKLPIYEFTNEDGKRAYKVMELK